MTPDDVFSGEGGGRTGTEVFTGIVEGDWKREGLEDGRLCRN